MAGISEVRVKRKEKNDKIHILKKRMLSSWQLYVLILIPLAYIIIFKYVPMYGASIAFKKFMPLEGILGSPWIGFANFKTFFSSPNFLELLKNTIELSLYSLLAGFPFPIILAIALNYAVNERFKKLVQMTTYIPHFISVVVMVGILFQIFSYRTGVVNNFIELLGGERTDIISNPYSFKHLFVWSGIWQNAGWSSIIYIAALSSIEPQLYEAAIIDGASKLQRIRYIDIPGILPTVVIMLILSSGGILNTGFEKVLLLQNPLNSATSEVIDTYVYKVGIASQLPNYSFGSAVGLFQSVVTFTLTVIVNYISKKVSSNSLW